ncbi:nucleoside hydrolase [Salmonella enterica subsp. enterica serovar Abony]|nr:nucleoside hydrolase [Salmonella enterica subsp. enterica serovar Richmond]EBX6497337.1 nucleoside hydrolase [Salmonella enterica subsp. enterica serovar Abony]EJB5403153.1 nucleoside hydrolase [Salmonella enterica]ELH0791643.1 nucleoside hydrolase [Salmonella enterica]HAK7672435.1 nucleoside hydrolase [Salmonella enterica]
MPQVTWPELCLSRRMELMIPPDTGKISVIIDSDTYNEIDDQIAIAWAMLHPERIDLQAVYAAPFTNDFFGENGSNEYVDSAEKGMRLSYEEIHRVFDKLPSVQIHPEVFPGASHYLKDSIYPEMSPAVQDLINRARQSASTIHILAIGAPTNIASALLLAPDIINNIHIVWLGGNSYDWKDNNEFNLIQDISASRVLFDSGVALTQIPCFGVANCMATSVPEIQHYFTDTSRIGNYIAEIASRCPWIGFASRKVIWDITTVGYILDRKWFTTQFINAPVINDNFSWSHDSSRHIIQVVKFIERDSLFKDLFRKIIDADGV